ncbi:tetratricopeptide repeat protein [Candidatus Dependentiae bacterium]|nr:tetratricopeptide repeat protein [Candidatus Dependentiae bacterium]
MKKIFIVIAFIIIFNTVSYSFIRVDGTNIESSKVLYKGEIILDGSFNYKPSLKPESGNGTLSIDVLSIPFNARYGLSKNREVGLELQVDNQKTEIGSGLSSSNRTTLSKIGIVSKIGLWKELSIRMRVGFSMNGRSYYSADGMYASGDLLYDIPIEIGTFFVNLGYEYVQGKFEFFENGALIDMKNRLTYGIGYNYPAMKDLNLTLEYSGSQKFANVFANAGEITLGAKYKLDADVILTGALSSGMQNGSADFSAKIGFQKYFGVLAVSNEYMKYRWKDYSKEPEKVKEVKQIEGRYCSICGYEAESDERFCPNDGTKLEIMKNIHENKCMVCFNELPENANFCPYCGTNVKKVGFKDSNKQQGKESVNSIQDEDTQKKEIEPAPVEKLMVTPEQKEKVEQEVESLLERAKMAFGDEDFNQAASFYEKAAKLDPSNSRVWYNKGVTHYMAKQYAEAKLSLENAVKNNPADIDSLLYLAAVNGRLRNTQEAIRLYKKVLELNPDNQVAKKNLSKVGVY